MKSKNVPLNPPKAVYAFYSGSHSTFTFTGERGELSAGFGRILKDLPDFKSAYSRLRKIGYGECAIDRMLLVWALCALRDMRNAAKMPNLKVMQLRKGKSK